MENYGWRYCRAKFSNKTLIIGRMKAVLGILFAAAMIFTLGLSIGILVDKEIFGDVYKDIGREEAIKEFSDLLEKIPGGEKGGTDRFMKIPSPGKEIIWDFQKGETARI